MTLVRYSVDRAAFLRRRRLAVERALRSARPVAERAADIAMEMLEDEPGMVRQAAAAALTLVLAESNPRTLVSLAAAVLARMAGGSAPALGGIYGCLMEVALSVRREVHVAARRPQTSQQEAVFA